MGCVPGQFSYASNLLQLGAPLGTTKADGVVVVVPPDCLCYRDRDGNRSIYFFSGVYPAVLNKQSTSYIINYASDSIKNGFLGSKTLWR